MDVISVTILDESDRQGQMLEEGIGADTVVTELTMDGGAIKGNVLAEHKGRKRQANPRTQPPSKPGKKKAEDVPILLNFEEAQAAKNRLG